MTERERMICLRVGKIREQIRWTRAHFANEIGISSPKLASIEYCLTPLRFDLARTIARAFDISLKWMAIGKGEMRHREPLILTSETRSKIGKNDLLSQVFDLIPHVFEPVVFEDIDTALISTDFDFKESVYASAKHVCARIKFVNHIAAWEFAMAAGKSLEGLKREFISRGKATAVVPELNLVLESHPFAQKNLLLTDSETNVLMGAVKARMPKLLERLKEATAAAGKKTELAEFLSKSTGEKVPLASVSRWLAGEREPGGEIALQMDAWATKQGFPK